MHMRDRWRKALKGRGWLEVRRDGVVQRRTAIAGNVVTDLGLVYAFWSLWSGQNTGNGHAGSQQPFFATIANGDNTGDQPNSLQNGLTYYDGTYYHAAWASPWTLMYASTDTTTPSASSNTLPGGTLIALGSKDVNPGSGVSYRVPSGQSVTGGGWDLSAILGTSPSVNQQTTTSTLVTVPFIPYAGSGTVTVGSVGFTNGLYAATSSTTSWTVMNGSAMSLTGSSSPASTTNLSIGTKLIPSTTLSVTNGEQLVVNYEISFTPA